jgi:uncharacterized protein (DUF1697 family)
MRPGLALYDLRMPTWVSLLRAINLGKRNQVNMAKLRAALEAAGFQDVRTLVQSGNVVTKSRHRSADSVSRAVRDVVRTEFDVDVPVIVRSPQQLRELHAWCPFPDAASRPTKVHVVHLHKEPPADVLRSLVETDWSPDQVAARGKEIVVSYADSMHASRLERAPVWRKLAADGTARNWRTLTGLVELTAGE